MSSLKGGMVVTDIGEQQGAPQGDPEEIKKSLVEVADLLLFRERFSEDPAAALRTHGVTLPPEVVDALASLTDEELTAFAKLQHKIADVPGSEEIGIFF